MMNTPLVSVVIPVYKTENYVKACVDSVLDQDYHNMEIILVDDGSPDKCPEILDEYASLHKNITVIHQKNGGLSAARNSGIKASSGKYIFFLDSDDSIEPDTISQMTEIAERENSHAVIPYKYQKVFPDGTVKKCIHFTKDSFREDPREFTLEILIGKGRARRATAVLYNNEVIKKHDITFPHGRVSEDFFFNLEFMKIADKLSLYDRPSLRNLKRVGSLSNRYFSDFYETIEEMDDLVGEFIDGIDNKKYESLIKGKREALFFRNVIIFVIQVMTDTEIPCKERRKHSIEYLTTEKMRKYVEGSVDSPFFEGRVQKTYMKITLALLRRKMYSAACCLAYFAGRKNTL